MSSFLSSLVLYMSSSFWLLQVESHDLSQAEKKRTTWTAERIYKMTIYSKKLPRTILSENSCHFVNLPSYASSSFFLNLRKIKWLNLQQLKTRGHVEDFSWNRVRWVPIFSLSYHCQLQNILLTDQISSKHNFCRGS